MRYRKLMIYSQANIVQSLMSPWKVNNSGLSIVFSIFFEE